MATHTNTNAMLEDLATFVREHPGATIRSQDDPTQRVIAFFVYLPDSEPRQFSITLTDLKRTFPAPGTPFAVQILSSAGRIQIAQALEVPPPIPFDFRAHLQRPVVWAQLLEDDGL